MARKLYVAFLILFVILLCCLKLEATDLDEIRYIIWANRPSIHEAELNLLSEAILSRSQKWEIHWHWILAIMSVEGDFRNVRNLDTGDVGYMQVNPRTAQWICKLLGVKYSEKKLLEAAYNLDLALAYFRYCLNHYSNFGQATRDLIFVNLYLATIAYNAGMHPRSSLAEPIPRGYLQRVVERYELIQDLLDEFRKNQELQNDFKKKSRW